MKIVALLSSLAALAASAIAQDQPPQGFTAMFNGKNFDGWRGGETFDHRELMAMPEDKRAEKIKGWTDTMLQHWKMGENGEVLNDGRGAFCTTLKEYGNFELLVDYNMAPLGDSGIYLRNVPQVQIWDPADPDPGGSLGRAKGSGGLWNNSPGAPGKDPLVLADNKPGEWNKFRIIMVGSRVSVWLNDKLVVDHAILENYYKRSEQVPAKGPICLQTHGAPIRWRNVFIKELTPADSVKYLEEHSEADFKPIFNGKDFDGWQGPVDNYEVRDGAIVCKPGKGGTIFTKEEYSDFAARVQFKLPPGGNNGLAIRYPGQGDTAYEGMTECQVLDDNYEKATGQTIDPRQAHGSAYGMVAAARGYQFPIGEWNYEEVRVKGSTIKVELNGVPILNADLSKVTETAGNKAHPGKDRKSGFFGFAGHNDPVMFRDVAIKKLQ